MSRVLRLKKRYGYAKSMSFGSVPPYKEFLAHIQSIDPDEDRPYLASGTLYPMELGGTDRRVAEKAGLEPSGVGNYGKPRYELTAKEVYAFVKKCSRMSMSNMQDEELREDAGGLASSIMSTLGYEWI